ncbi:MAG: UbiA family prenyltransferase [Candidatus Diapherotrites archaeon]|nr:UbiA family prenyltransferase [Candidatus Diapherotrites archaeon]
MKKVSLWAKLKAIIELGRPENALLTFLATLVGALIAGVPLKMGVIAGISAALISMGAQAVNDYFDVEVDRRKGKRAPLVRGALSKKEGKYVWMFYFGAGVLISFLLTPLHVVAALIASLLSYLYSARIQRLKYVGNLLVSFLVALSLVYGGLGGNVEKTLLPAVIVFLVNWGREVLKDVTDGEADYPLKISLYHVLGRRWAVFFGTYLIFLGVILTPFPYLLGYLSEAYLFFIAIADLIALFAIAQALQGKELLAERLVKLAMGVAVVGFVAGAIG